MECFSAPIFVWQKYLWQFLWHFSLQVLLSDLWCSKEWKKLIFLRTTSSISILRNSCEDCVVILEKKVTICWVHIKPFLKRKKKWIKWNRKTNHETFVYQLWSICITPCFVSHHTQSWRWELEVKFAASLTCFPCEPLRRLPSQPSDSSDRCVFIAPSPGGNPPSVATVESGQKHSAHQGICVLLSPSQGQGKS